MPWFAFKTLDGLIAVEQCPRIDEGALSITRPVQFASPPPFAEAEKESVPTRKYIRGPQRYRGFALFEEIP